MTDSYKNARTNFKSVSNIWLPQLTIVSGMFEDLGSNNYMVDISGATENTLTKVKEFFDIQTNVKSKLDEYNKNVWNYTIEKEDVTYNCELSCFFEENIVVIMYSESLPKKMSESYKCGKAAFEKATGLTLPSLSDIDAQIYIGQNEVMFDLVGGSNCTYETYENLANFVKTCDGWSVEDTTELGSYPTYSCSNLEKDCSFQIVWNSETEDGIYLNVLSALNTYNAYTTSRDYFIQRFDITLPVIENISADFSCAEDYAYMTFDLTKETNFTESEYNQFVEVLSAKLGNGNNEDDEIQKRNTWEGDNVFWDVVWDLTTGVAINFNEIK